MNFPTSTHKREWLLDAATLRQRYVDAQQAALEAAHASAAAAADVAGAPDAKKQRADSPISVEDEALLRLYYAVKLRAIVVAQQLPSKVLSAAMVFFKRFYTQASCLEHDPLRVMPTCIYLACKVEESYRSADALCKQLGIDSGLVLRFEVPLLQGLKFDLVVHSPYRALAGLFQEFDRLRSQQQQHQQGAGGSTALDPPLLSAPSEALSAAHAQARAMLDALLLTDAPLLHPPGALALAALRAGFASQGLPCAQLLAHMASKAAAFFVATPAPAGGGAAATADQQQAALLGVLDSLTALIAEQQALLQDEGALQARATEIDRSIKLWRKAAAAAAGGGGGGAQQGAAAAAAGVAAG